MSVTVASVTNVKVTYSMEAFREEVFEPLLVNLMSKEHSLPDAVAFVIFVLKDVTGRSEEEGALVVSVGAFVVVVGASVVVVGASVVVVGASVVVVGASVVVVGASVVVVGASVVVVVAGASVVVVVGASVDVGAAVSLSEETSITEVVFG